MKSGSITKASRHITPLEYFSQIPNAQSDQESDVVHELRKASRAAPWAHGATIQKAVKGSSITAIVWIDDGIHIRVYYRDPGLYLREHCQDTASGSAVWSHADSLFDHGHLQPSWTPISAEVLHERPGYVRISLSWKDAESKVVNIVRDISSHTIPDNIRSNHRIGMMDGSG